MSSHRATFDLLMDKIVSRIDAHATAQEAENSLYAFNIYADWLRDRDPEGAAIVFVHLGPITAQIESADMTEWGYEAQYWLDCVAYKPGDRANSQRADEAAGLRVRYLIKQVLDGLDFGNDRDLGLPTGTIRRMKFPRIEPHPLEFQVGERSFVGHRMTFDFELAYTPATPDGTAIDKIEIDQPDAASWSILLDL